MSAWMNGRVDRRAALKSLGAAGAGLFLPAWAGAAGAPPQHQPDPSLTWSPKPHPRAGEFFVIDGVAHCYNHSDVNLKIKRPSLTALDVSYSFHAWSTPTRYRMTPAQYARDWQADEVMDVMFLESHTNMIVMHSVPLYHMFWDGLVSNEKGAYMKAKYPDRVLWYGAVDIFDTLPNIQAKVDQLLSQGADGIKLYPTRLDPETHAPQQFMMDDEKKGFPVFEYIRRKGCRHIATHKLVGYTGPETAALGVNDYYRAAEAFPDMTFHIVHGGWLLAEDTAALMKARENVTAVLEGPMLWTIYDMPAFNTMMDVFMRGVDRHRIIYASTSPNQHPYWIVNNFFDYRAPSGARWQLSDDDKRKILGENLARYHGVDIKAQRAKIANDRFSTYVAKNGFREPYVVQRSGA